MFLGDRTSLTASANTAGFLGALPEEFVMSGQSAGGGFATAVGGYYSADPVNNGSLRGVVMFDGVSFRGVLSNALSSLDDPFVPIYQIAAPPQSWNSSGALTKELVAARPGQFVGATLAGGSHADALIGGEPIFDFFAQLVAGFSPRGNTQAVYTLATGWINDMYLELGPTDGSGVYGAPDQYIVMGDTAAIVLAPPPVVDLARYLGTWFEVGSVKQFFSIGLVNTTAVYSLNPDGSIKVENSGNYFVDNGPKSSIVGSALPVDTVTNNKLNVRFFGPPAATPPGNYWIVDLDPDYRWAVVTDSSGRSGFLLTRDAVVSTDFYQELLDRASVNGVKGRITPTRQPAAAQVTTSI
jgi:lipocalin